MLGQCARTVGKRRPNIGPTRWPIIGPTWWPYVEPTCWPYVGPMSKITLGHRFFYDVWPTCTYYHGPTLARHSHAIWERTSVVIHGPLVTRRWDPDAVDQHCVEVPQPQSTGTKAEPWHETVLINTFLYRVKRASEWVVGGGWVSERASERASGWVFLDG